MSDFAVTEEMLQRTAWRRRLVEAVLERKFDDETLLTMLMAGLDQAHAEGLLEAADVCRLVAEGLASTDKRAVASTLQRSLKDLVRMDKDSARVGPANGSSTREVQR